MPKSIKLLRIFLWSFLALILFFLLWMKVVPFGKISYENSFKSEKGTGFLGDLGPEVRTIEAFGKSKKIVGEPVYFSLRTPRNFNTAELVLYYRNISTEFPIIEAGILTDNVNWRYNLKPVENKVLDHLSSNWPEIRQNNKVLWQREKNYNSLSEFLADLPDINKIALYNYSLQTDFKLDNYSSGTEKTIIDTPLRGSFQFYTYIKNEELDFNFELIDLNQNTKEDRVDINLYYQDKLITAKTLEDDGVEDDSGEVSDLRQLRLKLADLPEGVYKIECRANDDILTKKISTQQSKLSFLGNLWFYFSDPKEKIQETVLYTDSREISAKTESPANLQNIKINAGEISQEFKLPETYKKFSHKIETATTAKVYFNPNNIFINGDGVFSFKKDSLLNPTFTRITPRTDLDKQGIDYVLANYTPPRAEEKWKKAKINFDLSRAYQEDGKYNFIISIPGMDYEEGKKSGVKIDKIRVNLQGKTLKEKLKQLF